MTVSRCRPSSTASTGRTMWPFEFRVYELGFRLYRRCGQEAAVPDDGVPLQAQQHRLHGAHHVALQLLLKLLLLDLDCARLFQLALRSDLV